MRHHYDCPKYPTFEERLKHPELDLNRLAVVRDPSNPSRPIRARHRLLMELLLNNRQYTTMRLILSGYPYLKEEWEDRIEQAEAIDDED